MTTREELEARLAPYWSAAPVYRGLDIDDGWLDLINDLVDDLERTGAPFPKIVQIKTKFGGLRFYVDDATEKQRDIIYAAEHESQQVCETCGQQAKNVVLGGWIYTLCEPCVAKKTAEREARAKGFSTS